MKKRKFPNAEAAKRSRELNASWQKLVQRYAPKVKVKVTKPDDASQYAHDINAQLRQFDARSTRDIPSVQSRGHVPTTRKAEQYEGVMAERDAAARRELEIKGKTAIPAFNKGPYQPLTPQLAADLKAGLLRRRP